MERENCQVDTEEVWKSYLHQAEQASEQWGAGTDCHQREALQKVKWQEGRIKSLMHKRDLVMTTV